ncbi:FAD-dependent oxidoreductase [Nonomuraea sediminis]|uniref:FAD-dependent oxidoreductase n=1 Tax=Nonomuraea sediminis TaxID=2835864 RepID=UPI001BDCD4B9|nr:FAD-dependent oxidoreductase [Nonomuraea sediminis]
MRVAVIGAGPSGLTAAMALARQGNEVIVFDRDPGPGDSWRRRGVMQFEHPHLFRSMARNLLRERLPDVLDAIVAAGAEPFGEGDGMVLRCRRSTFERALRAAAVAEPGVSFVHGHVDRVTPGDLVSLTVDGVGLEFDLVVDAAGRTSRVTRAFRPAAEGCDSGIVGVSRSYRLLPGAAAGPVNSPPGYAMGHDGYALIVFIQDDGVFAPLIVLPKDNTAALSALRHPSAFSAALRAHPVAADWISTERAEPIGPVRISANLFNSYRGQPFSGVTRVLSIGDSVCTTNPTGGRGVSLGIASAIAMTDIVGSCPPSAWACALDAWCERHLRPWFHDALLNDEVMRRQWAGLPLELSGPLAPDLILRAASQDPSLLPAVIPYLTMHSTSAVLEPVSERAREILRGSPMPALPGPSLGTLLGSEAAAA